MNKKTKISVAVITYNQEDTIRQTLDSILMQKGDFDLELVIGEDCSKDHTWDICNEYATKYPDIVRLLPNTHNLGITANYFRVLQACTGEYIADISGDDYYCDDYALAKQEAFLQHHLEVGFMGARGYEYFVKKKIKTPTLNREITLETDNSKQFYFSTAYKGGVYVRPVGDMMRRDILRYIDFDEIIRRHLPVEDYPMQAIFAQHCHFACLPDLLVVYRIYDTSSTFVPVTHPHYLSINKGLMDTRRYLNELFPQDACFSEEWMQDYEFYKEFLLYLHKWQYKKAKDLLAHAAQTKAAGQPHYMQAKRMTRSWLRFIAFAIYKELMYIKDIKNRT
ncbi:MAG: glycosyltransferase family 2 protein [Bacteroidales bacterium]|nr:glycosyltransferase family 2 protein [Candidatus Colicola caccequi]